MIDNIFTEDKYIIIVSQEIELPFPVDIWTLKDILTLINIDLEPTIQDFNKVRELYPKAKGTIK